MNKREFIRKNRKQIDEYIRKILPYTKKINDKEKELWVMNDETLFNLWKNSN